MDLLYMNFYELGCESEQGRQFVILSGPTRRSLVGFLKFGYGQIVRREISWACKFLTLCLGLLVSGCSQPKDINLVASTSASPSPETDRAESKGRGLYQSCLLCHSTKEMQRGPILNGLPAWYVENQTMKFQSGVRGSNPENRAAALMAGAVSLLSTSNEVAVVAQHISDLPVAPHLRTVRGDVERGRQVYQLCVPCHGEKAQGKREVNGPPLNVQEDWYLLDQLRKFKLRIRGDHPADLEGQAMAALMSTLTDPQLRDVVTYVNQALFRASEDDGISPHRDWMAITNSQHKAH